MDVVAVDLGGTHARFALTTVAEGRVVAVDAPVTLRVADHAGFPDAWAAFAAMLDRPPPRAAAIAVAAVVNDQRIDLTNNDWVLEPPRFRAQIGVETCTILNDFAAIGHAVAQLGPEHFLPVCGPEGPLPEQGAITVCGPGTGLGVAAVVRGQGGYRVIATQGGHADFAPIDVVDDVILRQLRGRHGRVSTERVVAGPGIVAIHRALAELAGETVPDHDDKTLWELALAGSDRLAVAAMQHFCRVLGGVAGDLALAHGPTAVVIAGGLGLRLGDRLAASGFWERFIAKGRNWALMETVPVKRITHPQPGLFGAAAAFAQEHCL